MTIDRIINSIHFNGCLPSRPEGVSEVRWNGMTQAAMTLYRAMLQEEAK